MSVLRDIFRRRARSALTISGIAIGMFALVVLGAAAENVNVYLDRVTAYYRTTAMVMDERDSGVMGMPSGNRPLTRAQMEEVARQPGVAACLPMVVMLLDDSVMTVGASPAPMVMGFSAEMERYDKFWSVGKGRFWRAGERGVAVAGQDFAKQRRLAVGDTVEVRGERFELIGIMTRSYISLNDSSVYLPVEDARAMYVASLPDAFRKNVKAEDIVFAALAYPEEGHTLAEITRTIEDRVDGVKALDQQKVLESVSSFVALFDTVLGSLAALGLVIGGLTIVNTMTMAVTERTREVGVMRALGASQARVARDVLLESAVMGALGGLGGIALGALASVALGGAVTLATGVNMFVLTWRLVVFALAFAVFLGASAGVYPAWHAARMDPMAALVYE